MEYSANINGIEVVAFYSDKTVREIIIPPLEHLAELCGLYDLAFGG